MSWEGFCLNLIWGAEGWEDVKEFRFYSALSPLPSSLPPLPPGSVFFSSPELRFPGVTTSLSPSSFPSASLCVSPLLIFLWFIPFSLFPPFFLLPFSFLSPSFPSFAQGWGRNAGTQVPGLGGKFHAKSLLPSPEFKSNHLSLIPFFSYIIHPYMDYQIAVSWRIALTHLHMKCLNLNLLVWMNDYRNSYYLFTQTDSEKKTKPFRSVLCLWNFRMSFLCSK